MPGASVLPAMIQSTAGAGGGAAAGSTGGARPGRSLPQPRGELRGTRRPAWRSSLRPARRMRSWARSCAAASGVDTPALRVAALGEAGHAIRQRLQLGLQGGHRRPQLGEILAQTVGGAMRSPTA